MQFHRSTIAALAATAFLTLFTADGFGANASNSEIRVTTDATTALTAETVPEMSVPTDVEFVSQEVVQQVAATEGAADAPEARSLGELVAQISTPDTLSREMECLAGAIYFEARGEPLEGQLAVGQVIVNRADSRVFPSDYCGVVFQKSQFSFVRGGAMPRINRSSSAWKRARSIARIAHEGLWSSKAGDALYFHANYVRPSWSRNKIARATIDTHIFYR